MLKFVFYDSHSDRTSGEHFIFSMNFYEVQLLCRVVLLSAVQQSELAYVCMYALFFRFPSPSGHHRVLNRLPLLRFTQGFPGGSDGKASACKAGDPRLNPGLGRSLEKGMATHSSILAWRILWTEMPGRLQSTGSQTVRHN